MFIVIEGADGTGKTTVAKLLAQKYNGIYTCEPTDPSVGKLSDFLEDRIQHDIQIKNWLDQGKNVICDRYKYSTVVYQQFEGYKVDDLIYLNRDSLNPDLTIVLDYPVEVLLKRLSERGQTLSKYETPDNLKRICDLYKQLKYWYRDENIQYYSLY
jgi:dTMP kinase